MISKTTLLASFVKREEFDQVLSKIKESFVIVSSKVFLLKNKEDESKIILTYNVEIDEQKLNFDKIIPNTISLHRKKETNTLYTINSLNEIVKAEHGTLDKNYVIDWINYSNCILITQKNKGLLRINTELEQIIDLEKK